MSFLDNGSPPPIQRREQLSSRRMRHALKKTVERSEPWFCKSLQPPLRLLGSGIEDQRTGLLMASGPQGRSYGRPPLLNSLEVLPRDAICRVGQDRLAKTGEQVVPARLVLAWA